jgi:putative ABC transport system substrate-binding protein
MQRAVTAFARLPNGGLVVTASAPTAVHRETITALAARHRLPAVYPFRYHITVGGLISYGPDPIDQYRRAAGYVCIAFSKAKSPPISQCRRRPSTSW